MENSHTINNSKNSIPNVKCECETIDWCNYHIHNGYCKWIREEISYEIYENICILSRKNSGRKFKELCMIAT